MYVWGEAPQRLLLTHQDKAMLEKPGSLRIAASIEDAIPVTDMLDVQYILVDALCIMQDDFKERKNQSLNFIGQIYRHAQLTNISSVSKAETGTAPALKFK
jgi:hypothetical protein